MKKELKSFIAALCVSATLTSCYNSHNAEYIVGKWQGTYHENCGDASRLSSVEIEFTADKKFTASIKPADGKAAVTTGNYIIERYKLIFMGDRKERDVQKIEKITETQFEGSFTNSGCSGTTRLLKVPS